MDLKAEVLAWLEADEDRIEEPELLLEAFAAQDKDQVLAVRLERVMELVQENLTAYPDAKFHDLKNMYPYPSSAELKAAQALLGGSGPLKKRH